MRNRWQCGPCPDADMQPKATRLPAPRPLSERDRVCGASAKARAFPSFARPWPITIHPLRVRPLEITKHHTTQLRGIMQNVPRGGNQSIYHVLSQSCPCARMAEGEGGRERRRLRCDQKNFWGVRSLVAAADRRDQILYRRTFRSLRAIESSVVAATAAAHAWFVA